MFKNSERQRSSPECSNRSKTKSRIRDYKKKISRMSDGVEDGLKIRDYKSNIRKFGTTKKDNPECSTGSKMDSKSETTSRIFENSGLQKKDIPNVRRGRR